jgi:hypothetical protein
VISRDGRQVLAESVDADTNGIWRIELDRGATTRLRRTGKMPFFVPGWDGFAFSASNEAGTQDLFLSAATSEGKEDILLRTGENKYIGDWSADGRSVLFVTGSSDSRDIWWLRNTAAAASVPLLTSEFNEIQPSLSPDGRWMAYASDESGSWEVHVQAFPELGSKRTISVGGGAEPLWSADGRELFYLSADHRLMSVDVALGQTLKVGKPRPLFVAPITWNASLYRTFYRRHYGVTPDAQRFVIAAVDPTDEHPLTVLSGWTSGLAF